MTHDEKLKRLEISIVDRLSDLIAQATKERSHYYAKAVVEETLTKIHTLEKNIDIARAGIIGALNELGVPQPDYPAPIANAVILLKNTLKLIEEKETK